MKIRLPIGVAVARNSLKVQALERNQDRQQGEHMNKIELFEDMMKHMGYKKVKKMKVSKRVKKYCHILAKDDKALTQLAKTFGRKVARIGYFKGYDNPEKSHTSISHSARKPNFKADKKRTQKILDEVKAQ